MSEDARAEYLSTFDLPKWRIKEVLDAPDVQDSFIETVSRMRFSAAAEAFSEFDRVTRSNELFMTSDRFALIRSVTDCMHSSLVSKEMAIDDKDHKSGREAWLEYNNDCVPKIKELVSEFQGLLNVR